MLCLAINTLAAAALVGPGEAFAWLTPGARPGLPVGGLVLLVALALPATPRLMLIALALMATTVLVNLAPPNPLLGRRAGRSGDKAIFLNFNGLTCLPARSGPS